jgi:transcription initiation factor IIE alpha subunit
MAVINNELEILSKLSENGIKSYKTNDFKKWLSELEEVNKNDRNYVLLSELKTHVNNLPEELGKEKAPESYQYIYNLIKKISQQ